MIERAIRMANEAHTNEQDRFYVLPTKDGKLIVMNRFRFRKLKQKGYIPWNATVSDLAAESFYHTPYKDGRGAMSKFAMKKRRIAFYKWQELVLKETK